MCVRISSEIDYLWCAIDHEVKALEVFAIKRRDGRAALKFLKRMMKRHGQPWLIVTDRLCSYGAAMKVIGNLESQEIGRWLNNRAETHTTRSDDERARWLGSEISRP